jgi:acyl-CoA hydrolase
MEVGARVEAENVLTGKRVHASSAYLVFVALDPQSRRPRLVPPVIAETDDERRRMREASVRREARLARRDAILQARGCERDEGDPLP